jgi:hypothetical protein
MAAWESRRGEDDPVTIDTSPAAEPDGHRGRCARSEALESGIPDAAIVLLEEGALLWHHEDKVDMDAVEGLRRIRGLHDLVDNVRVEVVQSERLATGWFQRIVLRGRARRHPKAPRVWEPDRAARGDGGPTWAARVEE